ncbi:hypothetical protein M3201_08715 [Paenibacillus motobuensis]|uniref:hypothetical protein n=1 Tax=Paenibacillus TaxID=44249 RepID=UPI00203DE463|nr:MULTISPECIES: hypothetical protein [Paenibacillus]MCM3039779.1 hypothetical protein [Paenibacillus lutimineralis]MCM3646883.1 hypothetical protein [Paenibacillus motobuensis]
MLRLVYYEIRKNYLRGYVLAAIFLFVVLNACIIYRGYLNGDGLMGYFMPHSSETRVEWDFYHRMHKQLDGPLTADKARFVNDEHERLGSLTADRTYSREQQDDTYTGHVWNDYVMITKYFYEPMKYAAGYEKHINLTVEKANENVVFYNKYNNNYEQAKNKYIQDHYGGRKIAVFYDGKPWELLFKYRFSDLLILLLLLLGLVPIYSNEKETRMDDLILSSRKGKGSMSLAKLLSIFIYIAFLLLVFSSLNLLTFGALYRFSGAGMPIYSIEAYQYTPFPISVLSFYMLLILIKMAGFVVIGLWLGLLSACFQRALYPYMLGVLLMVCGIYTSGYLTSVEMGKTVWAMLSPFTLLKGNELLMELTGMNIGNMFVLRLAVCLVMQLTLSVLLYLAIRLFSTSSKLSRRTMFPVKEGA